MIPKVIHYCWFGGNPLPESVIKCIESWRKFCPGYEIKKWTEDNYDINKIQYIKEAYQEKKYAFVSDFARLDIIYNFGGIYLDTDVELIDSLDGLINNELFLGMESAGRVNTGIGFGGEAKNEFIKKNIEVYNKINFNNHTTCVTYTSNLLKNMGLKNKDVTQRLGNIVIFSSDFFCPMSFETKKTVITKNTISIHHFDMTWQENKIKFLSLKIKMRRYLGSNIYEKVKIFLKK